VAATTFGVSIWLAVFTVITVSTVYRLVMTWVPDGTGGSGLSEEEFGGWAGKMNAGITLVEYFLTFLVSMAALVTFLADRWPPISGSLGGVDTRTCAAIGLSIATVSLVSRGPRIVSLTFGPATAGVLLLLWALMAATIWRFGLQFPSFDLTAFNAVHLPYTLGGYARILALMTGIEVFANLVGAYSGTPRQRSRKAFGSLILVMGTTSLMMLIVGPAMLRLSDPMRTDVSVFTQTLDALFPDPLAYAATLVGIAVLLSACATAVQGIQYLSLGMTHRHYAPAALARTNSHGVADRPVWVALVVVASCFALFGTREETYLALYAAGVFVLLSMTAWAAARRLSRNFRRAPSSNGGFVLAAVLLAAALTTTAMGIILWERMSDGLWVYLVVVPLLFFAMTRVRRSMGPPSPEDDCLGQCIICSSPCLGPGHAEQNARGRLEARGEAQTSNVGPMR